MTLPDVAIVIPTLNEAPVLRATLAALVGQKSDSVRVVVADGGSTDGTQAIAQEFGVAVREVGVRGRGSQVAAVAGEAKEAVFLVLHADMHMPSGGIAELQRRLADHPQAAWGCFGHRFDSSRLRYRWLECWDAFRARRGMAYGDQAQFFRKEALERAGGFPDQPIMEDVELSRRLRSVGPILYLGIPVTVSPRRFERVGFVRAAATNLAMRLAYRWGGTSACFRLYRWYYRKDC